MSGPATPPATVTRAEFAAMKGWAKSTVTRYVAAGRLVLTPDGKKIDVEASNRRLEETAHVDRMGVRERHARTRKGLAAPDLGKAAPEQPPAYSAFNLARTKREEAAAAMAEMQLHERKAELVSVAQVRDMGIQIAGIIARGFERIAPRIGSVWSTEHEPARREQLLDDELNAIRTEWANEIETLIGPGGVEKAKAAAADMSPQTPTDNQGTTP